MNKNIIILLYTIIMTLLLMEQSMAFEEDKLIGFHKNVEINATSTTLLVMPFLPIAANCVPSNQFIMKPAQITTEMKLKRESVDLGEDILKNTIEIYPKRVDASASCTFLLEGDNTFEINVIAKKNVQTPLINFKNKVDKGISTVNTENLEIIKQFIITGKPVGFFDMTPQNNDDFKKKIGSIEYKLVKVLSDLRNTKLYLLALSEKVNDLKLKSVDVGQVLLTSLVNIKGKSFLYIVASKDVKMAEIMNMIPTEGVK